MTDYKNIYKTEGARYHQLIRREDVDGNLRSAMEIEGSLKGLQMLDLGSGTGRIPLLFPDAHLTCLDLNWSMLAEQTIQRDKLGGKWGIMQGDMRYLPIQSGLFDVVTAGWALGHFPRWYGQQWKTESAKVLAGMARTAKPGGRLILIETLTTGSTTPIPPSEALAIYYAWLEKVHGFSRQEVQTDYLFESLDEAIELAGFFFGEQMTEKVQENNWVRLPEWTGVWMKRV